MPQGKAFVKHEFDEAIAIQQAVVDAVQQLSSSHPVPAVKSSLQSMIEGGEKHLQDLKTLGATFGATGKEEDVADGMTKLMKKTLQKAKGGEESDAYEAHAVLLSLKRKQQDSSSSMLKIANELGDQKVVASAKEMQQSLQQHTTELANSLADFGVRIAKKG